MGSILLALVHFSSLAVEREFYFKAFDMHIVESVVVDLFLIALGLFLVLKHKVGEFAQKTSSKHACVFCVNSDGSRPSMMKYEDLFGLQGTRRPLCSACFLSEAFYQIGAFVDSDACLVAWPSCKACSKRTRLLIRSRIILHMLLDT
jgi:hypothetical protein